MTTTTDDVCMQVFPALCLPVGVFILSGFQLITSLIVLSILAYLALVTWWAVHS